LAVREAVSPATARAQAPAIGLQASAVGALGAVAWARVIVREAAVWETDQAEAAQIV
jgi:hypothetical protein